MGYGDGEIQYLDLGFGFGFAFDFWWCHPDKSFGHAPYLAPSIQLYDRQTNLLVKSNSSLFVTFSKKVLNSCPSVVPVIGMGGWQTVSLVLEWVQRVCPSHVTFDKKCKYWIRLSVGSLLLYLLSCHRQQHLDWTMDHEMRPSNLKPAKFCKLPSVDIILT